MPKIIFLVFLLPLSLIAKEPGKKTIEVSVIKEGFNPKVIRVKPGTDVILAVTRKTDITCSKEVQIPSLKIKKELPLNQTVQIALGKVPAGEIKFGCGMNMMDGGSIHVAQ